MLVPNADRAVVDIRKLRDYCLNPDNPRGCNKARVFISALGLTAADANVLREKLLAIVRSVEAEPAECDKFGQRYTVDFEMESKASKVTIRSGWIILRGETVPRLTTCFVRKGKRHATTKNKTA